MSPCLFSRTGTWAGGGIPSDQEGSFHLRFPTSRPSDVTWLPLLGFYLVGLGCLFSLSLTWVSLLWSGYFGIEGVGPLPGPGMDTWELLQLLGSRQGCGVALTTLLTCSFLTVPGEVPCDPALQVREPAAHPSCHVGLGGAEPKSHPGHSSCACLPHPSSGPSPSPPSVRPV